MDPLFKTLAEAFVSISDPIHDHHWYLTKEQHASEFVFMNLIYIVIIFIGYNLIKTDKPVSTTKSKNNKTTTTSVSKKEKDYHSIFNTIVAIVLAINVVLNLIYKCIRGWRVVFFMLQPCHIVSCIYCYCLITNNYERGLKVFKVSIYYIFVTIAALAAPDLADLTLPFEVYNFFIQHYALLIAPFLLQMYRYNIKFELSYALISQGLCGMAHFLVFEVFSFYSGTNINYMLFPPPLGNFDYLITETYRVAIAALLFILSILIGVLVIKIGSKLRYSILIKKEN